MNVLTSESLKILDGIAEVLLQFPGMEIIIKGHTDSTGEPEANLQLSLLRAVAVRDYLVEKGVSPNTLRAMGFGEAFPVADNQTAKGRSANRRIEFTY